VTSEASIEQTSKAWLELRKGKLIKIQGTAGWPDRLALLPNGRHFFVEFKKPGGELSLLQRHTLRSLRDIGHEAFEVDNITLFKRLVNERC